MKKVITAIITVFMMICILPVTASAEKILKAPTVQYKLINHNEIALRWTEVDGADGYYVYRTDVDTGKTVRYKEYIKDTTYDVTRLKASTDYIFKVAAVSENNGQINVGKKSKGTKLTTPYEWYYYYDNEHYHIELNDAVIKRRHYNNTGIETIDMSLINEKIKSEVPISDRFDYSFYHGDNSKKDNGTGLFYINNGSITDPFCQCNGYVHFRFYYRTHSHDFNNNHLCRMKNNGSDFEIIDMFRCNKYNSDIFVDFKQDGYYIYEINNENAHDSFDEYDYSYVDEQFDNYKTNPESSQFIGNLYSRVRVLHFDHDSVYSCNEVLDEENCSISGPVTDCKYVFFLSEPLYNITEETDSVVYRCLPDGSDIQKTIRIPKDNSFIYGDPNNGSMYLLDCDGEYLYYFVYGRKANEEDRENYCTFYRISINEKKPVSMKLAAVTSESLLYDPVKTEISNGYMYIDVFDDRIDGHYTYYRIKTDGTEFEEQDEPFEWRY